MSKVVRFLIVICLFANQFMAPLQAAASQHQEQTEIEKNTIAEFVRKLNELAFFEELGEPIPFTVVSPSDERALRLGGLFNDLADRIAEGNTSGDQYDYGDVSVLASLQPANDNIRLSFTASRVITAPVTLSLEDPASDTPGLCNDGADNNLADPDGADQDDTDCSYIGNFLYGGGIKTSLALNGDFIFSQEGSDIVVKHTPVMTLSLESAANDILPFADHFGFTDVVVKGAALLNEVIDIKFNDPDGDGRFTGNEWNYTAIEDLTTVEFKPGSTVVYSLSLEPDLPGLDESGIVSLNIDRSANPEWPNNTTIFIPESLRVFANIDSDKALAGLNSYAVSLNAALLSGEVQLPFLDMRFSDAFLPGDPIVELIKQQTDALVICGKTDTLPPTGDPANANPLYCQAITYADPSEVINWTLESASLEYSDLLTKTVGISPQKNVKFDRNDISERPRARVEFKDPDGQSHTVFTRVLSAKQLAEELNKRIEEDDLGSGHVALRFDPESSSLMYDITMGSSPPMTTTHFAFADQLRQSTHLANLRSTANTEPEVRFTDVVLSSTFGILLGDDNDIVSLPPGQEDEPFDCEDGQDNDEDGLTDGYDPDCPAPNGPGDRFFIVPSDSPAIAVDNLVLTHTNPVSLTGNIGFLGVSVAGTFALGKGNHGENLLEIDFLKPLSSTGYANVDKAIRIRDFLANSGLEDADGQIQRTANISTTAGLLVWSEGLSQELTGAVGVEWDLATSELPTITPDPAFSNNLRPFDIAPTLAGVHTRPVTDTVLTDTSRDFVEDLGSGVRPGDVLNLELVNLSDGSNCASFEVKPHMLTCVTGYTQTLPITGTLAGGQRNYWAPGDEYEVRGDPQALGNLVLDSFYKLASEMEGLDLDNEAKAQYAATLPLIGLSPGDLATQFDAVAAAVVNIKSGTQDAEIVCQPAAENEPEPGNLFCQAFTDVTAITAAKWSLSAGHGTFTETTPINTVGISPTATTAFSISVPTAERDEFLITLVFSDSSDTEYGASYPPTPINNLSDLQKRLAEILSRQYGADAVNLSLGLANLPNPQSAGGTTLHLAPQLVIEEEGTRPYRLQLDLGEMELTATDLYSSALSLEHSSKAQFDLGIPLSTTISAYDVLVPDTTGLALSITAGDSQVDLQANLGGAEVAVGVSANLTGTHRLEKFTGTHTSAITSTTTLTASQDIGALGVQTGTVLTNTGTIPPTKSATCIVQAIKDNVVTCQAPLSGNEKWENGDRFELTASSNKRLHNLLIDFSSFNIQSGSVVVNNDKNASCTIESPIPAGSHVLSCMDALTPTAAWDEEDEYEIQGIGDIRMALTSTLAMSETMLLADFTDALTHTFSSPYQDVISATLAVVLMEDKSKGQVVKVAYGLEDIPDGTPSGDFGALLDAVQDAPIDWTLLPLPIELLDSLLQQNLDGQWWNFGVPLVGYDLAAGADVTVSAVNDALEDIDLEAGTAVSATMQAFCDGPGSVMTETVRFDVFTSTLRTYDCTHLPLSVADDDVKSLEITFTISETEATYDPAFDLGLPGLPVTAEDDQVVQAQTSWALTVTFGLSQTVGPYIKSGADDELQLKATAQFTSNVGAEGCDKLLPGYLGGEYSSDRCLNAVMGFLPGTLFDSNGESSLVLTTTLNLQGDNGMLTFGQLLKRSSAHTVRVGAIANVDVAFSADFDPTRKILPIAGEFNIDFKTNGMQDVAAGIQPEWISKLDYKNVKMDPTSFFGSFVGPLVEDVQDFTRPLQPPVDALSAPVPIINDLSQALGQGPVSMLTMLETISGNDLTLLERLGSFISFINNLPADREGVWIGLGGEESEDSDPVGGAFSLNAEKTVEPVCGDKTEEKALGTTWTAQECYSKDEISKTWEKDLLDNTKTTKSGREVAKEVNASAEASYTAGGVTLPFLSDSRQIYGMLLGIDATLLRVDFGSVSAGAGFSYSYYTVFVTPVGPIPVEFIVGGDVSVSGRFAMGYDTRGLRHALTGESFTGEALLDGIFIDDYDADGNEVPELTFEATFYAGAAVSIYIVKVGLEMGVTFRVDLDLNDPNADGKMYIDEIMLWRFNPVCLFEFTGTLEFFLRMFVEVDLFFFTARAEWYPFRHSINLFNIKCEPPSPVLAEESTGALQLNIGQYADRRNIYTDVTKEKIVVRQLTAVGQGCSTRNGIHEQDQQPGSFKAGPTTTCPITQTNSYSGTWVSVVFQGIKQRFFLTPTTATATVHIYADAGDGNDVIRLEPGSDKDGNEVPFELHAKIHGGAGDDRITTGGGDDVIYGDGNDDVINAGLGNDTVWAGDGNDKVDANIGNDVIYGGAGDDILNGGPGIDALDGGGDNDRLTGGPGLPSGKGFDDELLDKDDVLVGGDGDDLLEGDFGRNILFGDALLGYASTITDFHQSLVGLSLPISFAREVACEDEANDAAGQDTLTGGNEVDLAFGGPENDSLAGGTGDDYLCGNAGHDLLDGRRGDDELYGGPGNDRLLGWSDNDLLVGGTGQDLLRGDTGRDALVGDLLRLDGGGVFTGSDALVGGSGNDLLLGDSGWITVTGDLSATITASMTEVLTSISLTNLAVNTGAVSCSPRVTVISGKIDLNGDDNVNSLDVGFFEGYPVSDGMVNFDIDDTGIITRTDSGFINDILIQNGLVDVNGDGVVDADGNLVADNPELDTGTILGLAIAGSGNADCLFGEDGTDYLFGGPADDRLFGDAEIDYLEGNDGSDSMRGGQDADTLYGDDSCTVTGCVEDTYPTRATHPGNDLMFGDSGDDQMFGDGGDDIMRGGVGEDIMLGDNGHILRTSSLDIERIITTDSDKGGSDTIYGDEGPDIILAGFYGDQIYGGRGNDTILGDQGVVARLADPDHPNDIWSTDPDTGGFDFIHGNDGDDLIIGGSGLTPTLELSVGDMLWGEDGQDIIVGDNAYIARDSADILEEINSTHPQHGDRDRIHGDDQGDLILGGYDGDWLNGDDQADTILGDSGRIVFLISSGDLVASIDSARSTYPTLGGSDVISGSLGADLAFGGTLSDTISGGEGPDILLGDHGEFNSVWPVEQNFRSIYTAVSDLGAGDDIHGNAGDDFILGQQGVDELYGDEGEDDLTGGHNVDGGADARDYMYGGPEDDVMLGDNGTILRRPTVTGWQRLTGGNGFDMAVRETMVSMLTTEGTYGDDCMYGDSVADNMTGDGGDDDTYCNSSDDVMVGGSGHDDMYGQLGDDYMEGNEGEDAMVGDLGRITNAIEDGSREQVIRSRSPFLESTIYADGSLLRSVELFAFDEDQDAAGSDDIMLGGDQADTLHGGPGDDLLNGDGDATSAVVDINEAADNGDSLFGGDGADAIWGGRGDDHLFGGRGDDYLDILPRPEMSVGKENDPMTLPADPSDWFIYAAYDNYQGEDIVYGGWDQDAMQADVGGPGPVAGDRLLDWVGAYNVYYVCGGAYGEGRITRSPAPHVINFLQQLAEADGAAGATGASGSSGELELAMVFPQDARENSHPIHDDHPGHFTCELDQGQASFNVSRTTASSLLTENTPAWTASSNTLPASCQAIRAANPMAEDGDYAIYPNGMDISIYCHNMDGEPKEYLSLMNSGGDYNFSQYTAGGASPGDDVRTSYAKVRIDPGTLVVDIGDLTFASSAGALIHGREKIEVTEVAFGSAADCLALNSQAGVGNIDLRGTPFVISDTFELSGWYPAGEAVFSANGQIVDLNGGGYCGFIGPGPEDDFFKTIRPSDYDADFRLNLRYVGVIFVDENASGANDGSSWANAFNDLQDALAIAVPGSEIWVAAGRYTPGDQVEQSFNLTTGVAVYGGFAGGETIREQRDWQANVTVLSGDLAGDDGTDANRVITNTTKIVGPNAFHVVSSQGANQTTVLDGFTVTGGAAIGDVLPHYQGGGMWIDQSSPTLANLVFRGNLAGIYGGGMYNNRSSPTLKDVIFQGNSAVGLGSASGYGGGMYNNQSSSPMLEDVTFQGNSALGFGGGMRNWSLCNPTLKNITFQGNSAGIYAGGLGNRYNSKPALTNVTFHDNTATLGGGMANQENSSATLANVTFSGNSAAYGGGVFNEASGVRMMNVIFSGNHADYDGGAIENRGSVLELHQVTLANNHADDRGGGLNIATIIVPVLQLQVFNSIFWGNTAAHGAQLFNVDPATPVSLDHSLVQGGCPADVSCGEFLFVDPLFEDAAGADGLFGTGDDDLRLQEESPAIDSGDDAQVPFDELDLDQDGVTDGERLPYDLLGYRRFYGDAVDMGACEWQRFNQLLPVIVR